MTSKISYFNALKEDMKRRIWPLALSITGFFFALPVLGLVSLGSCIHSLEQKYETLQALQISFTQSMLGSGNIAAVMGLVIMAFINGLQGMKYLHSKQETDFYGALPMLRTTRFSAAFAGGLLITAIPFFLSHLLTAIIGFSQGFVTPGGIAYGVQSALYMLMIYCLIYTLVVLASILTGHIAVAFAGALVLLLGVTIYLGTFEWLASSFFITRAQSAVNPLEFSPLFFFGFLGAQDPFSPVRSQVIKDIPMKGILVSLGSLAAAAMLFFGENALVNARPAESAGRAMAFKPTKPLIKVMIMIPASLLFGMFFYNVVETNAYAWLIFGLVIGVILSHAAIEIIYDFDFKACIRHPISGIVAGVITALVTIFFVADPIGYDTKIPDQTKFESGAIYVEDMDTSVYYGDDEAPAPIKRMNLTDVGSLYALAKKGTDHAAEVRLERNNKIYPDTNASDVADDDIRETRVTIALKKRNGSTYTRQYELDLRESDNMDNFKSIFETEEYKNSTYPVLADRDYIEKFDLTYNLGNDYVELKKLSEEDKAALLDALAEDTKELDIDTVCTLKPVAQIDANTSTPIDETEIDTSDPAFQRYAYGGMIGMVYPTYKRTLDVLATLGADVSGNYDPKNVSKITRTEYPEYDEDDPDADYEPIVDEYTAKSDIDDLMPELVASEFYGTNYAVWTRGDGDDASYDVEYKDGRNTLSCSRVK